MKLESTVLQLSKELHLEMLEVSEGSAFAELLEIWRENPLVSQIGVVSEGRILKGVVSREKIMRLLGAALLPEELLEEIKVDFGDLLLTEELSQLTAKEVMEKPFTLNAKETVGRALLLSLKHKVFEFPVCDEAGKLVGNFMTFPVLTALLKKRKKSRKKS